MLSEQPKIVQVNYHIGLLLLTVRETLLPHWEIEDHPHHKQYKRLEKIASDARDVLKEAKNAPIQFTLTPDQMAWVEDMCDDDAGMLVKPSTLQYVIEKIVTQDREERELKN